MSDFETTRAGLNASRADHDAATQRYAAARAALRGAELAERALRRVGDRDEQSVATARTRLEAAHAALGHQRAALRGAIAAFAPFSDPRTQVGKLKDGSPCLLFPVRLETRFKTVAGPGGATSEQLWVRVYPDTCLVDTFEAALAGVEVAAARLYWQGIWRAGHSEPDERAAWRGLVASHGSGRAGWIVDSYRPANEADHPTRALDTDVILVVTTEAPLPAAERPAIAAFWRAHWLADGAAAGEQGALTAFRTAVGAVRADELVTLTRPFNLGDRPAAPLTKLMVASSVAFLELPAATTKDQPWTQAPKVDLLPDRLVLIAEAGTERVEQVGEPLPSPLIVGPDPYAAAADQLHQQNGDLVVPDELAWMVDFERAVTDGLGFKLDLTPSQARRGFDRVYVLGIRLSADEQQGKKALETLLSHHRNGRSGLSLVPSGTPTNNTEAAGSGFSRGEDADSSFDERLQATLFTHEDDGRLKQDGQWLAELLGIDPATLAHVSHASGHDQRDARAMQTALWPATLGYFLSTMLDPLISDADVEHTRWFFTNYVSGLGGLPALRIGAQPYGILPTTAFSRIRWLEPHIGLVALAGRDRLRYLHDLHAILQRVAVDWSAMARDAPAVPHPGDPHQSLLGILGLHPSSAEFHYRYAQDLRHLFNHLNLLGLGEELIALLLAAALDAPALALLQELGADPALRPEILRKYFLGGQGALLGAVIDDRPLSETDGIRVWTSDGRSYLTWLVDAARSSLDALRVQSGFIDDKPPTALLYLLLRHALMLGYHDAGREFHRSAGFGDDTLSALKREPPFIHIDTQAPASESRFAALYKYEPLITLAEPWTIAAHIAFLLPIAAETESLREQLAAIELLEGASTARLERAFAEHIDCCTYRFDAWQLGLARLQLERMRGLGEHGDDTPATPRTGVYLGAYGWLENVRPRHREVTPVQLTPSLAAVFARPGDPPLVHDSSNGGYIHAPSLNQAVTAAVLRSGYLANATESAPDTLAVNLSSDRVRLAVGVLEGIRNGQSLASLLGYRFERGLHDRHENGEVDQFVLGLRQAFPLRANRLQSTTVEGVSIDSIEARNVVDGLRLVEHVNQQSAKSYPWGLPGLPGADPDQLKTINAAMNDVLDARDALADLALAEGVYQAVQGNYDRVGATMETYTTGQFPPEPDVVRTPATGVTLTHRVGLHLQPGLGTPAVDPTPRSIAEPAVNRWLADMLPPFDQIACRVVWDDPVTGAPPHQAIVTMRQLGLQPLDLLALVRTADQQAMTELDDRVLRHVLSAATPPRPDAELQIRYMERGAARFSVFEVAPLVAHLRSLLVHSRPLRPADVALPNEATERSNRTVRADRTRVAAVKSLTDTLELDAVVYLGGLQPLLDDQPNRRADVVSGIDTFINSAVELLARGAELGLPQASWGFALAWRQQAYAGLIARIRARVKTWNARLADLDAKLLAYDALPFATPADERFDLLQRAESTISPALDPLPSTPTDLRNALNVKRGVFDTRRALLNSVAEGAQPGLAPLLAATDLLLPLTAFDGEPFDLDKLETEVVAFAGDLAASITTLRDELKRRSKNGGDKLAASDTASPGPARVEALQQAAQALLGDDFRLVPEFTLAAAQGDEWELALAATNSGDLLRYLTDETTIDFPVDEWLSGVARVRKPIRHLEQATVLAGALGLTEPVLKPIQLPHAPSDRWLALEFPPGQAIDGERLLYTACYSVAFAKAAPQCGLLLDEWTEVVPGETATTGIAFNYDQPSSEAPQTMLLVTPAHWDGTWQWDDLTGALAETLELAKVRSVEPVHVDATAYARFLPATITAVTLFAISISMALAANNRAYDFIRPEDVHG
jgi:hypothetical protein